MPGAIYFKPQGVPLRDLEEVVLGIDEVEALRLADSKGLSQEAVGEAMHVSRATVGRILEKARGKVADALVSGKALRINGGPAQMHPRVEPPRCGGHSRGPGPGNGHGRGRRRRNGGPSRTE